jgi:hypothetical protein
MKYYFPRDEFETFDFTLPGRTYFNLPIPPCVEHLEENDFLILNVFSNDVFEKHIEIEERRRGHKTYRIIHLTQVRPFPMESLRHKLDHLMEKIKHLKCRVLVLDNIYRHIQACCPFHPPVPYSFRRQKVINDSIFNYFYNVLPNVRPIRHTRYLGFRRGRLNDWRNYARILYDNVHLWDEYYYIFTKKLIKYHLQPLRNVRQIGAEREIE